MPSEKNLGLSSPLKIIHVGFGKTATTALQLSVLPKVAGQFGLEYIRINDSRIRRHASRLNLGKEIVRALDASAGFIMSAEDIHSWDPFFWEEWADKNQKFFGADCHVLITIREPRSYLTSVYLQMCLHEGNVQSANDLFLNNELYSPYIASAKFAIDLFSYKRIIETYKSRFNTLTVAKYESLSEMTFLKEFFVLSENELSEYKKLFESEQVNRSYSQRAVELTFGLQKCLNSIGLSLDATTVRSSLVCLNALREDMEHAPPYACSHDVYPRNIIRQSGMKMANFFRWSSLMRRVDMYLPYHKFNLNFEELPQIDIKKLTEEYEALSKIGTFRRVGAENIATDD